MENRETIELCLEENEFFCPEVMNFFYFFVFIGNAYLNATEDFLDERLELKFDEMDIKETLNLVREFLANVDKKYLEVFDRSLSDGTFDLFLPEDDLVERPNEPVTTPKPQANINVPITYTIEDGAIIIHEFFHFLNDTDDLVGVREIFTEMISIYYEFRYYQFLLEKGYNSKIFYKEIYKRIDSTFCSAEKLCFTASVLDIYHNTGDINEQNIEFLDSYRNLYKSNMDSIIDYYQGENFEEEICRFRQNVSYVIGTLLTFFALKNPEIYDIKMKYINEKINELLIEDVLNILDTKLYKCPIWIEECVRNLKKALGEINEQDYSNSRTDRSR